MTTHHAPDEAPACPHSPSLHDAIDQDPYPLYEQLREGGPVQWDSAMQAWLVTSYEACAFVGRREDLFSLPWTTLPAGTEVWGERGLFMLSGPVQRAMHKQLLAYFQAHAVTTEYRSSFIRPLADRLIDGFIGTGKAELGSQFADGLPIRVIAALLGMPWQDDALVTRFKGQIDDVGRWAELLHHGTVTEEDLSKPWGEPSNGVTITWGDVMQSGRDASRVLGELLLPHIRERGARSADDLISALWEIGRAQFPDWGEEDVLGFCRLLCVAGSRTTSTLLCNALYLLLTRPDLLAQVQSDRARWLPPFIEETLRLFPSLHVRVRYAATDTELEGAQIEAGATVHPLSAAANRDPSRYSCPADIDLERPKIMNHQAFNVGPRHCAGAPLARAEAFEALDVLLERLPGLRLDPAAEAPRFLGFNNRPFRPLHVLFEAS